MFGGEQLLALRVGVWRGRDQPQFDLRLPLDQRGQPRARRRQLLEILRR